MNRKKAFAWAMCFAWMGVIFLMSAMPGDVSSQQSGMVTRVVRFFLSLLMGDAAQAVDTSLLELLVRKGAHMTEYAILFLLYHRALRLSGAKHPGIAALLLCAAYAGTDEFHQGFVDSRGPSIIDVGIDTLGAGAAWGLLSIIHRIKTYRAGDHHAPV